MSNTISKRLFALHLALHLAAGSAVAQLPVATGRQFALREPQWVLFVPEEYTHRPSDAVDLLVHFHGDPQTVWNNVSHARLNAVVVTANYRGLSSVYRIPFSDPALLQSLLDDALEAVRAQEGFGRDAHWDKVAVSSFSAGYGAVREILKSPAHRDRIDAVLAADSLYASTDEADGSPVDEQMAPYKLWADLAVAGRKRFVFTHTRVPTPTYESTLETGDELLAHLGLEATPIDRAGLGPLVFYRTAREGDFVLWGSPGETGEDHMNHLRFMAEWLGELELAKIPIGDATN